MDQTQNKKGAKQVGIRGDAFCKSFVLWDEKEGKVNNDTLFTIIKEEVGKSYIVYTDHTKDRNGSTRVYANIYSVINEYIILDPIKTDEEWAMIKEKTKDYMKMHIGDDQGKVEPDYEKLSDDNPESDDRKIFDLTKESADEGILPDMYELGRMIIYEGAGDGDIKEAYAYLETAAIQGYPPAMYETAKCLCDGIGTEWDIVEAFKFYKQAVDEGYPPAMYEIARIIENAFYLESNMGLHTGVETDLSVAFAYYKEAADKGYIPAMICAGRMLLGSEGVNEDREKAVAYLKEAESKDSAEASMMLSELQEPKEHKKSAGAGFMKQCSS